MHHQVLFSKRSREWGWGGGGGRECKVDSGRARPRSIGLVPRIVWDRRAELLLQKDSLR